MTIQSPSPFPLDGYRELSLKEKLQRQAALSCSQSDSPTPSCQSQIFVGLFFDGTGNNLHDDYEVPPPAQRKHSNVVRLFHAFRNEPKKGYLRYYMPGVGTPFPEVDDEGGTLGSAAAFKGEERIHWGLLSLINAPHTYITKGTPLISNDKAKTIVGNLGSSGSPARYRRMVLNTWQEKLQTRIAPAKPQITQINLSVFGFSRGAAEARTFVNWLFEVCKQEQGNWTFAGIPLRIQFLGLFDTVASVGIANLYEDLGPVGHQSWADNSLEIHPAVERCVHFVAGHEVRACFPLDSVRVKSSYPANTKEIMYPGAHSDIGGGYAPGALGVSLQANQMLATIPGRDMYEEARRSGVPLLSMSNLVQKHREDLTPAPETISSFNAYLKDVAIGSGLVEDLAKRHMSYYFSYRFKYRQQFAVKPPYVNANKKDQGFLRETQTCLVNRLSWLVFLHAHIPRTQPMQNLQKPQDSLDIRKQAIQWQTVSEQQKHQPLPPKTALVPNPRDIVMAENFEPATYAHELEKPLPHPFFKPITTITGLEEKELIEVAKRINVKHLTPAIEHFLGNYVHDSMAGFIDLNMNEYKYNNIGFVKFRTTFSGND